MAFPTEVVSTDKLDQGTDSPKEARITLYDAVLKLNAIIQSWGAALGICKLDAAGHVESTALTGAVDHAAIQDDAVEGNNIKAASVNFAHLKATITNDPAAPVGGADGDMHFIYD